MKNVRYDIPVVNVSSDSSFTTLSNSPLEITPGATEPITFRVTNRDGKSLVMHNKNLRFVVWTSRDNRFTDPVLQDGQIVFVKEIPVENPYATEITMLLSGDDTRDLGLKCRGLLPRWSLFLIDRETNAIFPLHVGPKSRAGSLVINRDIPDALLTGEI